MRARVIDNFLPNAAAIRAHALSSAFIDWEGHDGETYKSVCLTDVPGLLTRLEEVMGPVDMLGMGYRLNFGGELPNAAIHSDVGWGTHALVLYLSEGEGGTAFWRHKTTGAHRFEPGKVHDAATDVPPIAGLASSSAAFDAIIRLSLTCAHFRLSCRGRLGENDNRRGFDGSGNRCFGSDCSYCSLATGWARTTTGRGAMDSLAR